MAAQVFDIFFGHILSVLFQELREAGLLVDLVLPVGRALDHHDHDGRQAQTIQLGPLAFRDDLAIALWGTTNQELLTKVIHATRIVQDILSRFHLQINYAASKSEATLALCKPDAKAVWQGVRMVGRAQKARCPALAISDGVHLLVARTYAHLGCQHLQDLSVRAEAQQMLYRSRAALKEKRPAMKSKHIGLKSRVCIHSVYVRCHLLQNIVVLQPFGQVQFEHLQSEFLKGLRLCADMEVTQDADTKFTNAQVLAKCEVLPLDVLMDRRALSFFLKLITVDHSMVRAAITASFERTSFWARMFAAINRLQGYHASALASLPRATQHTIGEWASFAILDPCTWRSLVKTYGKVPVVVPHRNADAVYHPEQLQPALSERAADRDFVMVSSDDEAAVRDAAAVDAVDAVPFSCDLCTFIGKSFAGLQAHKRRSHNIHTPLSLRVTSPKCDCCDLNFGQRHRVLDHLRTSKRCADFILANVEPLSPVSFDRMMEANRYLDESDTRMLLPKPGPKPKGIRPPRGRQASHTLTNGRIGDVYTAASCVSLDGLLYLLLLSAAGTCTSWGPAAMLSWPCSLAQISTH
eukprot:4931611-Amphidinium_carterae.1